MNDKHMFAAARETSFEADYRGSSKVKIGCVIAYKGAILAKASNSNKTHTMQDKYNVYRFPRYSASNHYMPPKVHAELLAISKIKALDIQFDKAHVYVYRELANGEFGMSRPCPACMAAIKSLGIKNIHYTTSDGYCHEVLK